MNISIIKADITEIEADAIVNVANKTLLGGGGVDGKIHRKAGPELAKECKEKFPSGINKGKAVATKAYNLKAKIIIHTVGPVYGEDDIKLLQDCYLNSLSIAEENKCKTIAFPAISTGAYGVPIEVSARYVKDILDKYSSDIIEKIILVLYDDESYNIYKYVFQ